MQGLSTRAAGLDDLERLLDLEAERRKRYETYQPEFWADADNSRDSQRGYFKMLLTSNERKALIRVAEEGGQLMSFAIGYIDIGPPVYKPQRVCFVDDFAIAPSASWDVHGRAALEAVEEEAKRLGATLTNVVCAEKDIHKREFLRRRALSIASEWWVGPILGQR